MQWSRRQGVVCKAADEHGEPHECLLVRNIMNSPADVVDALHVCAGWRILSCPFRWFFYGRITALFMPESQVVPAQGNKIYRFADCELDPRERRLLVHGQPVVLTPKVFDTLVLLVSRAGHVVSKDELTAALWPRGFVHESNLTKHIWLIRRALGDGSAESHYIETVPKLGYRFIARVNHTNASDPVASARPSTVAAAISASLADTGPGEATTDTTDNHEPTPGTSDRRRSIPILAASVALAALVITFFFAWNTVHTPAGNLETEPGSSVAIVDFNNLSTNPKDAWLGPALTEMLATELSAGSRLHAVPGELVRPARADLAAPMTGGYAPASLMTLHRRLGSNYILSGSYLVFGDVSTPQLRLDLVMQDARNGATIVDLSRSGAVTDLPTLVVTAGTELRERLGAGTLNTDTQRLVANAQPSSAEVARHIGFALDALHQFDPARARDEALEAIAQAPGYAPAYVYLAQAWSALGYRAKALTAMKQALANSQGLPEAQRLQIAAQQADLEGNYALAADTVRKLIALDTLNLEYRMQLVDALTAAGKYDEANSTLTGARKLPEGSDDPRLELAEAKIATARDDEVAAAPHARTALHQAQTRGETGLVAEAELQLGIVLGQDAQAESLLRGAVADFRRIENPHGEARAWQNLGNLQNERNQIIDARETYQRAMIIYQGIGDLGGEAAIYDDLARMLWTAGDRDAAETATRRSLQIARETDDLIRQAWNLAALATMLLDESAGDDVVAMYQQAIVLDKQSNSGAHLAFTLFSFADMLRMRGQLVQAYDICAQARTASHEARDDLLSEGIDFECAQIELDRGKVEEASTVLAAIEQKAVTVHDAFYAANAQLVLGQIAMGRGQWNTARIHLESSLQSWQVSKEAAGEATLNALLALCYEKLGDGAARAQAATRARDLRGRVTQRAEVFEVDIALAELQGEIGKIDAAIATLQTLAGDAAKRHWVGYSFEARLSAQRLLDRNPGGGRLAKASRDALRADAQRMGFGWVTQRLALMPSEAAGSDAR